MKMKVQLAAAALAVATLAGCDAERSVAPAPTTPTAPSAELVRQVQALGFKGDDVRDYGTYVVVEGDVRISKKDLASARAPELPAAVHGQRYVSTIGSSRRVVHVNLSAVAAENASWANATRAAMTNWNNVTNADVQLVESSPADLTVVFVSGLGGFGTCTAAQGKFPSSGAPGDTVFINRDYVNSYSYAKQVFIMTHELGHNLGLAHTNTSDGSQVPGTPPSDGSSVMNNGSFWGNSCPLGLPDWSSFSYYDQVALRALYTLNQPNATLSNAAGSTVVSWPAATGASYYEIERYEYSTHSWGGSSGMEFGWQTVSGTSYSTGYSYTGVSQCTYYDNGTNPNTDYFCWRVRSVSPSGKRSDYTQIGAQDAVC